MARITYITNKHKEPLFHLLRSSNKTKMLAELLKIDFKSLEIGSITEISSSQNILKQLEKEISHYLKIRNNSNPEYGIEQNRLFKQEDLYEVVSVLGNKMNLYYGNEDGIINSLAKLHNELSTSSNKVFLFSGDNHSSVLDLIKSQKSL